MQFRTTTLAWSAVGLLALGTATGLSAHGLLQTATPAMAPAVAPAGAATPGSSAPIPMMTAPNYRAIVSRNEPAVVGITTQGPIPTGGPQEFSFGGGDDNPFAQFFRGFQIPRQHGVMHAQGSGFLISSDGLVLTNAHVVDGAKQVTVKLSDHREFKAKVLGADKSSDIAVLKIEGHDLPTVMLGNSDKLGVGDYVLAIGEPFGLEETATAGIVSAKGRSLPGDGYVPFIQTDAAVNPGNSGGPLFDAGGSVVGINAQIYSNSGGFEGVSFAIPINLAVQIKDQIVKTGKVAHSRLGVEVQTMNQTLADSFKLKTPNGALVAKVVPDSAAAQAGIKVGDVILKFNGAPVIDAGQLSQHVGVATPGEKATIEVWRDGKTLDLTATVGNAAATLASADDSSGGSAQAKLGLAVRPLNPEERQQAGVAGGLVVEDVQGRAAEAGIQPGDVVLSVDGTPVQTVAQLRRIVKEHDKQVALLIQRGDARLFVPVSLG
ncbi:MAG TPA: Do family serine endopeptidase [Steroidobacteraceae bacterium]|jgi:serine protease Do|nr:Do family serine endopeptidase [Steroidobacteraceae bacterium]